MIARRRMRRPRRGSLLAETAMSAMMLMIAMSLITRVVGWTAADRRNLDRRQWAVQEAANLMERLSARPFEGLSSEAVKDVALSPEASRTLPDAALEIEIVDHDPAGGADSKRIAVKLRWKARSGEWDAPVRLTAWVHSKRGGSR